MNKKTLCVLFPVVWMQMPSAVLSRTEHTDKFWLTPGERKYLEKFECGAPNWFEIDRDEAPLIVECGRGLHDGLSGDLRASTRKKYSQDGGGDGKPDAYIQIKAGHHKTKPPADRFKCKNPYAQDLYWGNCPTGESLDKNHMYVYEKTTTPDELNYAFSIDITIKFSGMAEYVMKDFRFGQGSFTRLFITNLNFWTANAGCNRNNEHSTAFECNWGPSGTTFRAADKYWSEICPKKGISCNSFGGVYAKPPTAPAASPASPPAVPVPETPKEQENSCVANCFCPEGGCAMNKCTDNCHCPAGGCEIEKCVANCNCAGGNCKGFSCVTDCIYGSGPMHTNSTKSLRNIVARNKPRQAR